MAIMTKTQATSTHSPFILLVSPFPWVPSPQISRAMELSFLVFFSWPPRSMALLFSARLLMAPFHLVLSFFPTRLLMALFHMSLSSQHGPLHPLLCPSFHGPFHPPLALSSLSCALLFMVFPPLALSNLSYALLFLVLSPHDDPTLTA
ncbi:hypothetical protein Pcinc_030505 [Petrolisthes cinctipes]|uniref:Uncharacterized protein n=1 Tax=Petrolisthes cinctipes TaxID=88211 RepID=A0AAE1EZ79_PETCI|nr:hypothetical protein Pcinc_030505 [Petrolisthes cinctipes]